jgi:hypothetical protein
MFSLSSKFASIETERFLEDFVSSPSALGRLKYRTRLRLEKGKVNPTTDTVKRTLARPFALSNNPFERDRCGDIDSSGHPQLPEGALDV